MDCTNPRYVAGKANGRSVATTFVAAHSTRQVDVAIDNAMHVDPSHEPYTRGYQVGYLDGLQTRRHLARSA